VIAELTTPAQLQIRVSCGSSVTTDCDCCHSRWVHAPLREFLSTLASDDVAPSIGSGLSYVPYNFMHIHERKTLVSCAYKISSFIKNEEHPWSKNLELKFCLAHM
jgi:hypothetical protein